MSKVAWPIALIAGVFVIAEMASAGDAKPTYSSMAPLDQYLMPDRQAEIVLARSAAPSAISKDATILVLARSGYESAIAGSNGFTCLVERAWMSPFDSAQFWNPKMRSPICFNPAASRSILPFTVKRTQLVLAGVPKDQIEASIRGVVARKELPMPEAGAMSYMMSKSGNLGDGVGHWHPHLMFHVPKADAATWGANVHGSPVLLDTDHPDQPEPQSIFMIPVGHWSDGTAATVPAIP